MPADNQNEIPDLAAIIEGKSEIPAEAGLMGRLVDKSAYIFAAGIVISAGILLMEVFLRYVLNSPTVWAHETTVFLCGIAFTFGGLYCASRNSHIRVVLIYDVLPPGLRRIFDVVISLSCAIASAFFAYASWHMVQRAAFAPGGGIRLETSGSAWNPPIPALVKIFVLLVMILLALQFLIFAVNYARRVKG